jgi:hypothetical protein
MPFIFLLFALFVLIIIAILSCISGYKIILFLSLLFIGIGGYILVNSMNQPLQVYKTLIVQPVEIDGVSIVIYKNHLDNLKIVNINEKLKQNIPQNTKIKITIYKCKYGGLYYLMEDKFEVLTPAQTVIH